MSSKKRALRGRKLLIASVGIATASFVGVGCGGTAVANLGPPPSCEVNPSQPQCAHDSGSDASADAGADAATTDAAADTGSQGQ